MSQDFEDDHEGGSHPDERWLVSYSDFITLLMVLFVVLYSMGQVDVEKYKQLAESMRAAFTLGGPTKVINAGINQSGGGMEESSPDPIVVPGIPVKPPASEEVAGELTAMLAEQNIGGGVSVQTNVEGVLISLSEQLLFEPGTAILQPQAYPILDLIISMIEPIENDIRIIGHTDNSPPRDPKYNTNWELSVGRAMIISNYLMSYDIAPERLIVAGRGEYDPVFPNDNQEHQRLNSRAELIIIYKVEENVIGIGENHLLDPEPAQEMPVLPEVDDVETEEQQQVEPVAE